MHRILCDTRSVPLCSASLQNALKCHQSEVSPVTEHKPIYAMGKSREPHKRDSHVSLLLFLPTGVLERLCEVNATVEDGWFVYVTFVWSNAINNVGKVMYVILQGSMDLNHSHGTVMAQAFMDDIEKFQKNKGDAIKTNCRIALPSFVKHNITE